MAGFINRAQQRDHSGQPNIRAADGRPRSAEDSTAKATARFCTHPSGLEQWLLRPAARS
ncbi:hypothetical protein [Streptomyces canus]|uniref:hypothetical protein n=1 Tax=Streptomyces canus TaxID=58343 RepID=UPI00325330B0